MYVRRVGWGKFAPTPFLPYYTCNGNENGYGYVLSTELLIFARKNFRKRPCRLLLMLTSAKMVILRHFYLLLCITHSRGPKLFFEANGIETCLWGPKRSKKPITIISFWNPWFQWHPASSIFFSIEKCIEKYIGKNPMSVDERSEKIDCNMSFTSFETS